MLEPRRLAARAAAERMAATLGERGRARRSASGCGCSPKVSARTRIEVVTEGVFTRMILDDPELDGVARVVFDEFHERSLDADLGLALARDAQALLRDGPAAAGDVRHPRRRARSRACWTTRR